MKCFTIILISSLLIGCNHNINNNEKYSQINIKNKTLQNNNRQNNNIDSSNNSNKFAYNNKRNNNKSLTNVQSSKKNVNNKLSTNFQKSNTNINNWNNSKSLANVHSNDINNTGMSNELNIMQSYDNVDNNKNSKVLNKNIKKLLQNNNNLIIKDDENDSDGTVRGFVSDNEYEKKQFLNENTRNIKPLDEKMREDSRILEQVYAHQNQIEKNNK